MNFDISIGLIGRICSGKSTIARHLGDRFNIPVLSFGGYLFNFSKDHNLKTDRDSLQSLGNKFIHEDSKMFLHRVMAAQPTISNNVIIEGIRHLSIYEELKIISRRLLLAFIDAPIEVRYDRYIKRLKEGDMNVSFQDFINIDNHPVESEIDLLKDKCQIVIDSVNSTAEQIYQQFSV